MEIKTGYDFSHWNTDEVVNRLQTDAHFMIFKATEGNRYHDKTFRQRIFRAINAGKNVGAYHFWNENDRGKIQAENYLANIIDSYHAVHAWHRAIKSGIMPYRMFLDVENCTINVKEINDFLNHIETILKYRPAIYCSLKDYELLKNVSSDMWIAAYSRDSNEILNMENVFMHQKKIVDISGHEQDIDFIKKSSEWALPFR